MIGTRLRRSHLLILGPVLAALAAPDLRAAGRESRMPGLAHALPVPVLPEAAGTGIDPGPPRKEPREEMEPDPSWTWPGTGSGQQHQEVMQRVGDLSYRKMNSLLEASLEQGRQLAFFKASPGERIGDMNYFYFMDFSGAEPAQIRNLARGTHGFLFWQFGPCPRPCFLTPTGVQARLPIEDNQAIHFLGSNSLGDLVYFGDARFGSMKNRYAAPGARKSGQGFLWLEKPVPGKIRGVFPGVKDTFWVLGETGLRQALPGAPFGPELPHQGNPWAEATSLAFSADGLAMVAIRPDRDQLYLFLDRQTPKFMNIPEGSRPHSVATGPDDQLWITLEGTDSCLVYASRSSQLASLSLAESGCGPLGVGALTLGPDGNMWMALSKAGALGRMTKDGKLSLFRLGASEIPVELVRTPEGILFTLEKSSRIGFIRAVPAPGGKAESSGQAAAGDTGAGWAVALPEPRPAREKKLSRAQRMAMHDERIRRARERQLAREEETGKAPEGEAPAPAEPGTGPVASLAALGVHLSPGDVRHILANHAWGRKPGKSQFAERHSTREALEQLLARGMEASGAIGRITDSRGHCYTKCAVDAVGSYHSYGQLVPASHFVVVTAPYRNEQLHEFEHGVVTAYPVHPNW